MTDREILVDAIRCKKEQAENELTNTKSEFKSVLCSTNRTPEWQARELIRIHARINELQQDIVNINKTIWDVNDFYFEVAAAKRMQETTILYSNKTRARTNTNKN